MKIAILFSGRIDQYQHHYQNILSQVVQDHDADFFLSHSPEITEDLDDFCRMYSPKTVRNDPIHYGDLSNYTCHPQSNSHNMMCMWINRLRVFQDMKRYMTETNTWYDLVISTRLDLYSDAAPQIPIAGFDDAGGAPPAEDNEVFVPEGFDWGGLNDQFAVGTFYAMEKYMSLYADMHAILDEMQGMGMPYYGPEPVLYVHTIRQQLHLRRFPYAYRLINGKLYKSHTDRILRF